MKGQYSLKKTRKVIKFLKEAFEGPVGREYRGFIYKGGRIEDSGTAAKGYFEFNNTKVVIRDKITNPLVSILIEGDGENILGAERIIEYMFPRTRFEGGIAA